MNNGVGENITDQAALRMLRNAFNSVAQYLPLNQVATLGQLHRDLRNHPTEHLNLSLRNLLSQYFDDPNAFRDKMRQWGYEISGSSALSFLMRDTDWTSGDIDIYCPVGFADRLTKYLIDVEGYEIADGPKPWTDYRDHIVSRIKTLTELRRGDQSIDIIESSSAGAVDPLCGFHSSVVMNYISADKVECWYPTFTFNRQNVRQYRLGGTPGQGAVYKYRDRGYQYFSATDDLPAKQPCHCACPIVQRVSGDKYCFSLPIAPEPEQPEQMQEIVVDEADKHTWVDSHWRIESWSKWEGICWNPWCSVNDIARHMDPVKTFGKDLTLKPVFEDAYFVPSHPHPLVIKGAIDRFCDEGLFVMEFEHTLRQAGTLLSEIYKFNLPLSKAANNLAFFNHAILNGRKQEWRTVEFQDQKIQAEAEYEAIKIQQEALEGQLDVVTAQCFQRLRDARIQVGLKPKVFTLEDDIPDMQGMTIKRSLVATMKIMGITSLGARGAGTLLERDREIARFNKSVNNGLDLLRVIMSRQFFVLHRIINLRYTSSIFQERMVVYLRVERLRTLEAEEGNYQYSHQLEDDVDLLAMLIEKEEEWHADEVLVRKLLDPSGSPEESY